MRYLALWCVVACASNETSLSGGNAALGIERFSMQERGELTTIIGYDSKDVDVARVDLIHGRFAPTGVFKDDYPGETEVIGRKLDVTIEGKHRLVWETAGFVPTLHMPPHPRSERALIELLNDPHIKVVLDRWWIGYDQAAAGDEIAFTGITDSIIGTDRQFCDTSCGSFTRPGASPVIANTCSGTTNSPAAMRATQPYGSDTQWHIAQCCPPNATNPTNWFARKTCPLTLLDSLCGQVTTTTACKSCAGYPAIATYHCEVWDDTPTGSVNYKYCDAITGCNLNSFVDNFNRTSGLGSSWQINYGGYTTDGSAAVGTSAANFARSLPSPAIGTQSYSVTAKLSLPSDDIGQSGLYARSNNSADWSKNLYSMWLSLEDGGYLKLYRRNNYNHTHLQSAVVTVNPNTLYTVKLVATGSSPVHLEGWFEGVKKIDTYDWSAGRHTVGSAGVENYNDAVRYDSFQIDPTVLLYTPATAPPTGSPFIDDFNRTGGLGGNWGLIYGDFSLNGSVANSVYDLERGDGNKAYVLANVGSADYAVTAVMSVPFNSDQEGIFVRGNDAKNPIMNHYGATFDHIGQRIFLYRQNNWSETQLGTYSTTVTPDQMYTLKLVVTGSNPVHLEVWLNGTMRISYNDSSANRLTTGVHGITTWLANVKFDSYRVDALWNRFTHSRITSAM